jgi:hypothetical protein
MEDSKKEEESTKKLKYVPPELVSLDKDKGAEGGPTNCAPGSGNASDCGSGTGGPN